MTSNPSNKFKTTIRSVPDISGLPKGKIVSAILWEFLLKLAVYYKKIKFEGDELKIVKKIYADNVGKEESEKAMKILQAKVDELTQMVNSEEFLSSFKDDENLGFDKVIFHFIDLHNPKITNNKKAITITKEQASQILADKIIDVEGIMISLNKAK